LSDLARTVFKTKDTSFKAIMIYWSIGTLAFLRVLVTYGAVLAIIGWLGIVASILICFRNNVQLVKPNIKVPVISALFPILFEVILRG
jgi:hypothetical protein